MCIKKKQMYGIFLVIVRCINYIFYLVSVCVFFMKWQMVIIVKMNFFVRYEYVCVSFILSMFFSFEYDFSLRTFFLMVVLVSSSKFSIVNIDKND